MKLFTYIWSYGVTAWLCSKCQTAPRVPLDRYMTSTNTTASVTHLRPAPTRRELEASLEAYFYRMVRLRLGGRVIKMAPTEKGVPDRLVLLPGGRVYLVELKALDGRTSAAQDLFHERAAELGTRVQLLVGRHGVDRWLTARGVDLDTEHDSNRIGRPAGRK